MLKVFVTGIVLGLAGIIAALYYVPTVNLDREISIVAVAPNGGNTETFHVNIPEDRIMVGSDSAAIALPPGMVWPKDEALRGTNTELFKLRNSRDAVIGVGSRITVRNPQLGDVIEWVLHLPARGTIYASLGADAAAGGRAGSFRSGTREFSGLLGKLSERWVAGATDKAASAGANAGKVELVATYVSRQLPAGRESME